MCDGGVLHDLYADLYLVFVGQTQFYNHKVQKVFCVEFLVKCVPLCNLVFLVTWSNLVFSEHAYTAEGTIDA
jgi:hypothetical protein